jgi:hypothetical protein
VRVQESRPQSGGAPAVGRAALLSSAVGERGYADWHNLHHPARGEEAAEAEGMPLHQDT